MVLQEVDQQEANADIKFTGLAEGINQLAVKIDEEEAE
jgi:hypothetical protein